LDGSGIAVRLLLISLIIALVFLIGCTDYYSDYSNHSDSCEGDFHCVDWKYCENGNCILRIGACDTIDDCEEWRACSNEHYCYVKDGRCLSDWHCLAAQGMRSGSKCDINTHTCI